MTIGGRLNYRMLHIEDGKLYVEFTPFLNIFDTKGRYCGRRNLIQIPKKPTKSSIIPSGLIMVMIYNGKN